MQINSKHQIVADRAQVWVRNVCKILGHNLRTIISNHKAFFTVKLQQEGTHRVNCTNNNFGTKVDEHGSIELHLIIKYVLWAINLKAPAEDGMLSKTCALYHYVPNLGIKNYQLD